MRNSRDTRGRGTHALGTTADRCEYVIFKLPADLDCASGLGGWVGVAASSRGICRLSLPRPTCDAALTTLSPRPDWVLSWTALLCRAHCQISDFLRGRRRALDLPIDLAGSSDFAVKVLARLRGIGYGQTCSYGDLAASVGRPRASRAVGRVMASNPLPLILPCHRVVGANGRLVGFGGGLWQKSALLELEASSEVASAVARPATRGFCVG